MSQELVLIGTPFSTYVRTARMACIEKQVPYQMADVEMKSAEHLRLHPWGKVPVMRHGDFELYETAAICQYLEDIGTGPRLIPEDVRSRARMQQWISMHQSYLYPALIGEYLLHYYVAQVGGTEPDRDAIAAAVPDMERALAHIERGYDGQAWLAGAELSIADLFLMPVLASLTALPESSRVIDSSPNIKRALEQMSVRASFGQSDPRAAQ